MGLDMYLRKCDKVEGWSAKDYSEIASLIQNLNPSVYEKNPLKINLSELCVKPNIDKVKVVFHNNIISYFDILEMAGYWRKANHIHKWFVENVQDKKDDCELYLVSKEKLEQLKDYCQRVKENFLLGPILLPTQDGFFFGGTGYDSYYLDNVKDTIKIIEDVLASTNFENQCIFYESSW